MSICDIGYDVHEVNSAEELLRFSSEWKRLLAADPHANFFQTPEWFETYWRHFGHRAHLRAMLVHQDGELDGIVPFLVVPELTRLGPVRLLGYPLDNWGTFFGPIGPQKGATLAAALRRIRRTERDWDVLDLRWVADGEELTWAQFACQRAGLPYSTTPWREVSYVDLQGGWDEYWMGLSSKWRNNVRRNAKRLASLGDVQIEHHRIVGEAAGDADPAWHLYEQCEAVAARSWQHRSNDGNTLTHDSVRQFLRDVHEAAALQGAVLMDVVSVSGRPVAFAYNYVYGDQVFGLRTGFDPEFAAAGPGSVLMESTLHYLFDQGYRSFDFGESPSTYKRNWRTSLRTSYRICHYPNASFRAQALRMKRWWDRRTADEQYGT